MPRQLYRRFGVGLIEELTKEAFHPMDMMRNQHLYAREMDQLHKGMGVEGPGHGGIHADSLMDNPEYFEKVKSLYSKYMMPNQTASEEAPKVVSVAK